MPTHRKRKKKRRGHVRKKSALQLSEEQNQRRLESITTHKNKLNETKNLLSGSKTLFTERRWDEIGFISMAKLEMAKTLMAKDDNDIKDTKTKLKPLPGAEPTFEELQQGQFEYRRKEIEHKITELNKSYKYFDMRSTVDIIYAGKDHLSDDRGGEIDEKKDRNDLHIDSSLWTKNEANETFAKLITDTKMIALPRNVGSHVTALTAAHRQIEAPMSNKNDFVLPNPLDGPRMLDSSRRSLSSSIAAKLIGSVARAGGLSVANPNRFTAHLTSKLTDVKHITFLPPLHGNNKITSSTTHEERLRIMERQMKHAAARRIQRMWNHRTGILILLARIRRRKQRAIEEAIRLKNEIADDYKQAAAMFARPTWACFFNEQQEGEHTDQDRVEMDSSSSLPTSPLASSTLPPMHKKAPQSPFQKSFKFYRNLKHIAHTLTLHPCHTMSSKSWRILRQECYDIVFHNADDKTPSFSKTHMKRWLVKLYKLYAHAPENMTVAYHPDAYKYWGKVDINKFAKATHFEPAENVVKILKVMSEGSRLNVESKPEAEQNAVEQKNGTITMLFPTFAKSLVKLCCLSTVDLLSFFVFLVNEDKHEKEVSKITFISEDHTKEEENKVNTKDEPSLESENKEEIKEETDKEEQKNDKQINSKNQQKRERKKKITNGDEKTYPPVEPAIQEEQEERRLGATQRRLEKVLCQIHKGHGNAEDLTEADFVEGPSGYSWAIDLEDMSGIVHRRLNELRSSAMGKREILGPIDLIKLLLRCPIFAYPCMYMQRCLRRRIFGEHFWATFEMCHHRPGLPNELGELSKSVERKNYHFMTLRHAWAETTRYMLLNALGVSVDTMDGYNESADETKEGYIEHKISHESQYICCVEDCNNQFDPKDKGLALCPKCSLKGVGIIADSVGIRLACRFRERTRWFTAKKGAEGLPAHNNWLLMRDKLSKCDFYFNGETAASRWNLKERNKNDVVITDVRPRQKLQRKKKRKKKKEKEKKRK
jgi:hypothetical protein